MSLALEGPLLSFIRLSDSFERRVELACDILLELSAPEFEGVIGEDVNRGATVMGGL